MIPIKPKDVTWTDEQWSAIYEDGKNILVSAGAGSGKTAVLTQRVIAKLKNGVSLRNLIILTFTNAAALEMKVRIRKELRKEILRGDNPHLKEEYDYPSFYGLTNEEKEKIEVTFPDEYVFYPSRNSFDYIYRVSDLAGLSGKKYHSKRNHISFFKKTYNWSYEEMNSENLHECMAMNEKWFSLNVDKDPDGIDAERAVLNLCFDNFSKFAFVGGLLRVDGEVVAFTFGEKLNDNTFVTHFEKAFADIRGAYPMINNQFALNTLKEYEFVNREDDIGSEGLRKAKLSYYPEILLEKFTAVKV